jgi:hypothetical protein
MIISKLRRKFKDYFGHLFRGVVGRGGEGEHFLLVTWDSI